MIIVREVVERKIHPVKSTLEATILEGRKKGNSTRQVDYAIQRLFEGFVVQVKDHYNNGNSR